MDDESDVIRKTIAGDNQAFARIVRQYEKPLLSFVSSRAPLSEVEDIVQETFIKAFLNLKQLKNPDRIKPWLFAICRSLLTNRLKEIETKGTTELNELNHHASELRDREIHFPLPPEHRELAFKHNCRLSYREIARLTGIPEKLVKSRIHESRKKLRKQNFPHYSLEESIMNKTESYEKGSRIIAALSLPQQLKLIERARENEKYNEEMLQAFSCLREGEDFVLLTEGRLSLPEAAGMLCLLPPDTTSRIGDNITDRDLRNELKEEMTLKSIGFTGSDSLDMEAKTFKDSLEISLSGYIDNYNAVQFKEGLARASEFDDIILNCRNLSYISSLGIGIIIEAIRDVEKRGGRLTFCSLSEKIWEIFELLGISRFVRRASSISESPKNSSEQTTKAASIISDQKIEKPLWPKGLKGSDKLKFYGSLTPNGKAATSGYDYLEVEKGLWAVIKYDTSGKKPGALAMAAQTTALFHQYFSSPPIDLEGFCYLVNDSLVRLELGHCFAAFQVFLINENTGQCRICSSGDRMLPYFDGAQKSMEQLILPQSPMAGFFTANHIKQRCPFAITTRKLSPGDTLYLYTDTLEEGMGEEKIHSILNREHTLDAAQDEIAEALLREERIVRGDGEATGDILLLSINYP